MEDDDKKFGLKISVVANTGNKDMDKSIENAIMACVFRLKAAYCKGKYSQFLDNLDSLET